MTWQQILEQFQRYNSRDNCFYMLTTNKGTDKESRTRFLTYREALKTIIYEVEKEKAK